MWTLRAAPALTHRIAALREPGIRAVELPRTTEPARQDRQGRYWIPLGAETAIVSSRPDLQDRPLAVVVPLDDEWPVRLDAAARLHALLSGGRPEPWLTEQRRRRITRALRTGDARRAGASYRDIANAFFGARRVSQEAWKTSPLKAQIVRLAAYGRRLVRHDYRQLLRGRSRR
ncbi:DUF2285 domain-containing protein [Hoeflea sp.]|uniref:DUF2285 domain-containing protein n=1 Tax=Hoeflea sp. TaxID=1940281 RepID=UPI003B029BF7